MGSYACTPVGLRKPEDEVDRHLAHRNLRTPSVVLKWLSREFRLVVVELEGFTDPEG